MSHSTDRDLLFGLLALQNNFIDRDALVDAFHRRTGQSVRSLDAILLECGAVSTGLHAALNVMVEEHIKRHGGNPGQSLEALSSIGPAREDLARVADSELSASLAHVAAARRGPEDDPYRTVPQGSVGESTSSGTRFRILRPHARGGLGEVFVALDSELNRDVALKGIQDRYADDRRYRARFEFEAEVTGGLEHPGIVPVYGLGHTADGRPFYAMRFIRGDSLKEAIRGFHDAQQPPDRNPGRGALKLRDLLGRFIDVCDAVAYAHSRGVLHRDLKPGNIMLGRYGETLVVDWGLAKVLERPTEEPGGPLPEEPPLRPSSGSALDPTQPGSAIGTPGYMSPEQVDSQLGPLGVRSDIYCLGATLYHLLTGRAPCEAEQVAEIYRKILVGDIPRPLAYSPWVAPALEAICLKSMALRPEDRYESAEALKKDIERWLADQPVVARPDSLAERIGRILRRHPVASHLIVVMIFSDLLCGLVVLRAVAADPHLVILPLILFFLVTIVVSVLFVQCFAVVGILIGAIAGKLLGRTSNSTSQGVRKGLRLGILLGFLLGVLVAMKLTSSLIGYLGAINGS